MESVRMVGNVGYFLVCSKSKLNKEDYQYEITRSSSYNHKILS